MIAVSQCKKILGSSCSSVSDLEVEQLRDFFVVLSDLAIDCYLAKRNKLKSYEEIKAQATL